MGKRPIRISVRSWCANLVQTCVAALITFVLSACSPGMFGGSSRDREVADMIGYRKVNLACAGIDLSSSNLDPQTFRQILHCFNSYGALEPIELLVDRISDKDLESILAVGNRHVFNNPKMLYQLERTNAVLDSRGVLDSALMQTGRMLENDEFVSSSIALLREGFNQGLLKSFERLSAKMTDTNFADLNDAALSLATAKAFSGLQKKFRGNSPSGRELRALTDFISAYWSDTQDPQHVKAGRELLSSVVRGEVFRAADEFFGTGIEELKGSIPKLSSIFKVSLANGGQIFDGLSSLFHYAGRPIQCLQGAKKINNPGLFIMGELAARNAGDAATFLKRGNVLTLMTMNPFCDYPPELSEYYPALVGLADTSAIRPAAEFTKVLYEVRPLADLLIRFLGDTGSGATENSEGIKKIIPVLAELNDRGIWENLWLMVNLLRPEDRQAVIGAIRFALEPSPSMGNQSIYDVWIDLISKTSPQSLYNFIYSLRRFVDSDEPLMVPVLANLRSVYYVNDAHPLLDVGRGLFSEAIANENFFRTLLNVSAMPEFQGSVRLISRMAKDGRLKDLILATSTLFHKFAMQGQVPIHEMVEPRFVSRARHDLGEGDLQPFEILPEPAEVDASCAKLDFRVPLGNYTDPRFDEQLSNLLACQNSDGKHGDIVEAVQFLREQKTEDGRSYFDLQIDFLKTLNLSVREKAFLMDRWLEAFDDGRLFRLLDAVPFWVTRTVNGAAGAGVVLRPLFDLFGPVMTGARENLRRLEEYAAKVLRRADFPQILSYVDELMDRKPEPQGGSPNLDYDFTRMMRWVSNKECESIPANPSDAARKKFARVMEMIDDYNNSVTTWDTVNGKQRRGWSKEEFRVNLNPLFEKMTDPKQSVPEHKLLDGVLNFINYFTLKPGQPPNEKQHFTWDALQKFLEDRSNDYRLLTYYYPGEPNPRVRLVNTLDRLELVLISSDFEAPAPISKNYGLEFLAEIAEAWGDEPREVWPEEIKRKFANGKPKTLRQVYDEMEKTQKKFEDLMGFPDLPECQQLADPRDPPDVQLYETTDPKARGAFGFLMPKEMKASLFNSRQTLSVVGENVPGSGTRLDGGMRILRNLFFEIYYSTPENMRDSKKGWGNNLSFIMRMVRMGSTRQIGRLIRQSQPDPESLGDFFRAFVAGSAAPATREIFNQLIVKDKKRDLIWAVLDQLFDLIDAAGGKETGEFKKELEGKSPEDIRRIREGWVRDVARLKQMAYYGIAMFGPMENAGQAMDVLRAVIEGHGDYLAKSADRLQKVFRSKEGSYFARAFYEDQDPIRKEYLTDLLHDVLSDPTRGTDAMSVFRAIDSDPLASSSWDKFSERWDALEELPEYRALRVDEITRQIFDFFKEGSSTPGSAQTSERLRRYAAERLESGDLDQMLLLMKNNPNEFYRVLETLSRSIERKEVHDFFSLIRRGLSDSG